MSDRFDAVVVFAEMRTGSNHLQESLNALSDVEILGEAFNPVFVGGPNREDLLGIDLAAREADPMPLLEAILARPGISGFRYFHDHDPRVLDRVVSDGRIAKVILTRNPLDAYVSLGIARATGQWRLTNAKMAKTARATFDGPEFDAVLAAQGAFRTRLRRALQVSGQAAFAIGYDDIGDLDVLNGLAAFLGSADRLEAVPGKLKKQNVGATEEKVANVDAMRAHLARLDPFGLARDHDLEPARGPQVDRLQVAATSPLLHVPVPGGPEAAVAEWLGALDGAPPRTGLSQRDLRPWMRKTKDFVSFAVLRHPVARAHDAFEAMRAAKGPEANALRRVLRNQHAVPLDEGSDGAAFLGFLRFLKAALGGQSALPVAPGWASQSALLAGAAQAILPQRLIREPQAQAELDVLAGGASPRLSLPGRAALDALICDEIEEAAVDAYRKDYLAFGFRRWSNS